MWGTHHTTKHVALARVSVPHPNVHDDRCFVLLDGAVVQSSYVGEFIRVDKVERRPANNLMGLETYIGR